MWQIKKDIIGKHKQRCSVPVHAWYFGSKRLQIFKSKLSSIKFHDIGVIIVRWMKIAVINFNLGNVTVLQSV